MKLYMLRIYQSSLAAAVILFLVVLSIYGISLADGATEKATHKTGVSNSTAKAITKSSTHAARTDRLAEAYGLLPLSFEANRGQTDSSVQFISHGAGYTFFLGREEAVLELQKPDETDALLRKMAPKVRKRFEARKFYHASPRFRSQRKAEIVRVGIAGANPDPTIRPQDQLPGKSNYFVGNDPKKWRTSIPSYRRVEYEGIYPGVDLIYYGNQSQIEFDFVVAPRVDPSLISLHIQTDGHLRLEENGSLQVNTSAGSVVLQRPNIYQVEGGKRRLVHGGFVLKGDHEIGFQVAKYDRRKPLIVDPVLSYSTFLGGSGSDFAGGIAVDSLGDAYIVGQATSTNFPIENGYPASANANGIAFISKLDPTGTTLLYSTYLGGTGGEYGAEIALDPSANVYVTGYTTSSDFPVVNGYQTALGTPNGNAFVARIDTTQSGVASLIYSTYLGGGGNSTNSLGDTGLGIAADASGFAYVTGQTASDASTTPFPTTSSAYQSFLANPNGNVFLSVLDTNQAGSASLVYSTYLGGNSTGFGDYGMGVAVDSSGDAFITGETTSGGATPFPTTSNAYQTTLNSVYGNVFVTEIATEQSGSQSLVYSTYLGGSSTVIIGDSGSAIALDSSGKVYVDGDTTSSDFPVTSGAFETTNSTGGRAFVVKLDLTQSGTQSLIYSTYLGGTNGSEGEVANGIAVDAYGNAFASGSTSSTDFPTTPGAYQTSVKNDLWNVYLTQMNSTGTALLYSTYLGGSCSSGFGDLGFGVAVDLLGNAYIDGSTCSSDFPVYPSNAFQTSLAGAYNAFIAKFSLPTSLVSIAVNPQTSSIPAQTTQQFLATGTLSDGSTVDLTSSATWSSSNTSVLTVSSIAPTQGFAVAISAGSANITATYGTISASAAVTVTAAVTPTAPSITSVTPTTGTGGTQVTIAGSGFGATQGTAYVTLGTTFGHVVSWSNSQIVATVASGSQTGVAQVEQGGLQSNSINFTVNGPTISSVSPASGVAGTSVTITGSGFGATQGSGQAWLGNMDGIVTSWSDTQVIATVAAGAASGTAQV